MRARHLLLTILLAAFAFGGTVTCKSTTSSARPTERPITPAR